MQQLERKTIGKGVNINAVSDPKFKHNRLTVNFVLPLREDTASDNAVVPFILRMGTRRLADFSALNVRLQELYGATLDAGVSKYGGYQVLEVSIRGLDDRYALGGEKITADCARLLAQIVLEPKLAGDAFDEKDTALQKQFLEDTIQAEINDKRPYAISQCLQTMCGGEPIAVKTYGYPETAAKITPQSAAAAYRNMLRTAPVEILFTGSGSAEGAAQIFGEAFAAVERQPGGYPLILPGPGTGEVREKTETMDIAQSKLVLGMRTQGLDTRRKIGAARLFSALYGGAPFSKLFQNVREKLSLCYYCASRFDSATRLLLVDSGVEAANKEKAQAEILTQLKAVQNGEFTDEEIRQTKLLMRGNLIAATDSPSATEGWYMAQILRGQALSPWEDADELDTITKNEMVEAARSVSLDTVYFLTEAAGKEGA